MNNLKRILLYTTVVFQLYACSSQSEKAATANGEEDTFSIIPRPLQLTAQEGEFTLSPETKIVVDRDNSELEQLAGRLAEKLNRVTGYRISVEAAEEGRNITGAIVLGIAENIDSLGSEGYTLTATPEQVSIKGNAARGIFYGIQTLQQLLPAQMASGVKVDTPVAWTIPAVEIIDKPRYQWRGMHLDVARHFFPVEFVKKYIDYIAMHKMNTFHWHLTEDQGWRIEIKKYPKLTEVGAYRDGTLIGHYSNQPQKFTNERYGGFYTQEEIKEVVAYAKERYINVVPEIEMPGHAVAALASYPELSCTGGPFEVIQKWGVFEDIYCAGNEQTFTFLEDVLIEVMALFPSKVIHIGGDESPKARWEECPKCQARIKEEGLKNEHELQSYFITRIEKFLNSKGRNIIGWDEILEGGLAPNAAVMSWRGMEGGIAAARQKHPVVMTPVDYVYFDYYQGKPSLEPLAIGGYIPLEKVYSFEPTPEELSAEEAKYIMGAQANLWTEYIPTTDQVEYMVMPRMAALSEVLWTTPGKKDWENFKKRMRKQYRRYDAMGVNYSKSAYQVGIDVSLDSLTNEVTVVLESDAYGPEIHYTLDGTAPNTNSPLYSEPFKMDSSVTIKAASVLEGKLVGGVTSRQIDMHKAVGKPVELSFPYSPYYAGSGNITLVNSQHGSKNHTDGRWLGFYEKDLVTVIDLKAPTEISHLSASFLQNAGSHIFLPISVSYYVSENGEDFQLVETVKNQGGNGKNGSFIEKFSANLQPVKARYVKVEAKNRQRLPGGESEARERAWLFIDEISVQ